VSFSHLAFLSGADGIENSFPFYFGAMMNGYFVDARPSLYEYQSAFSLSLALWRDAILNTHSPENKTHLAR
jgi:hypothetical protein